MKNSKKVLALFAAAAMAATMGAMVACEKGPAVDPTPEVKPDPVVTGAVASKVVAVYTFDELTGADGLSANTFKGVKADGTAATGGSINGADVSGVVDRAGKVAVNMEASSIELPATATAVSDGIAVSAWVYNALGDWGQFIFTDLYIEDEDTTYTFGISCGNIDPWGLYGDNYFPSKGGVVAGPAINEDLGNYDAMCAEGGPMQAANGDTWIYVTVVIDANDGILFYRNGELAYNYVKTLKFANGATMGEYCDVLSEAIAANGIHFAGGSIVGIDDVVVSTALTAGEVAELYNQMK